MDSNVSKNTFSHKFFKLDLDSENTFISVKDLLKQKLYLIFDLYLRSKDFTIDLQLVSTALEPKIDFLESFIEPISSNLNVADVLLTSKLTPIVYKCSIAVAASAYLENTPQRIAVDLANLIDSRRDNIALESGLNLCIQIIESGSIIFYPDSQSLAGWLQQLLFLTTTINTVDRDLSAVCRLNQTPSNLFFLQYIYARCSSLLCLAARQKLIIWQQGNFGDGVGQLSQPESISWLDSENNLWLEDEAELYLIFQLLMVIDSFNSESDRWVKLAINFGQAIAMFITECRFLGEIYRHCPQRAIARVGLIAIAHYWLKRILIEKLNIAAPTSL